MPSDLSWDVDVWSKERGEKWLIRRVQQLDADLRAKADAAEGLAEAAEPFTRIDGAWDPQRLARALARFRTQVAE